METNKRKKKSGSEGRKLKKMRLAEEAKSRVQMEQYFVKKTPVKEKGIEKPGTSLLSNNQSRVDLETNIMQSSGSDEEEQITTENVNTEITLPLDTDSGQTDIAISSNVAETSNTPGIDEFDHVNFDDVPEDIPTVDRGHLDKEKETSSSDFENIFNVSAVLERNLTHEEKIECLNQKPCQPSRDELKKRKKKQYNAIPDHETSQAHMNAKLSQVMFLQQRSLNDILKRQDEEQEKKRLIQVEANRRILKRVVETIMFLGKQELAFRGHRESLASDSSVNKGNFLETLKYLAEYDDVMALHLESVERDHIDLEAKKKGDKARRFGRGSKLTFLSNDMQNKIIAVISKEIAKEIVNLVKDSVAWAVIADTTPDVSKHEQFSLCVRVVTKSGEVSEHQTRCTV
ncbi:zinc finger MYM-type protein 1-like [Clytia hemisphaerica]|uniref:zinc finger MYM-type protein 1-like n=1 Tax=Clytia hemisphaerica TaxID=252671 RepID=UPI0034D45F00